MAGYTPQRSTNSTVVDYTWLASADGIEYAQSATLDATSLSVAGGHHLENWLKSGTPLGIITASGKFGLYDPAASDGRQNHVGFLVAEIQLVDPTNGIANSPLTGAVIRRGQIIVNRLPVAFNPALATASKQFIYR